MSGAAARTGSLGNSRISKDKKSRELGIMKSGILWVIVKKQENGE